MNSQNATLTTSNSASLYYFATEVYAFDIAVPGEGCVGKALSNHDHDHDHDVASTATTHTTASTSTVEATSVATTTAAVPAETTEVGKEQQGDCHTHDDGVVHCT